MKKIFAVLLIICLVTCMTGCLQENKELNDEIASRNLSQDQKDIVNLLSYAGNQNVLFFDFKTEQPYKHADFWVEIYENGTLIDKPAGVSTVNDEAKPFEGEFTVVTTSDQSWILTLQMGNLTTSHMSDPVVIDDKSYGRLYGAIDAPVKIESGKEIVLYTSIYANDVTFYGDQQMYVEQPNLLLYYPYVQIVKCKFE